MSPEGVATAVHVRRGRALGIPVRLAITVALVYALHFTTNVVRETYLAVSLAERFSIHVDPYVGLHPDLFEIPGRGAFITNNPGASMLGAIPYAVALPLLEQLYRWQPALIAPKPPTAYDDPRPNRTRFMNLMRARGLDIRLALAAIIIQMGLNVPLGALSAVMMFLFLRRRLGDERSALWLALLFAIGTPMFFRSAFLNQNLLLAHCTLLACLALIWPSTGELVDQPPFTSARLVTAGILLGVGVLCDYSGVPILLAFALWVLLVATVDRGLSRGLTDSALLAAGASGPIALLCVYQYVAFGNPFVPAQAYMPSTQLSGEGWHGLELPRRDLIVLNLFSPSYGIFVYCPMLAAALFAPRSRGKRGAMTTRELFLLFGASAALYLFSCSVSFAALQWNTGIRYLVPAIPLLFLALVPVLLNGSTWLRCMLIVPSVTISWALSMTRENVPGALSQLATSGLALPWYTVLQRTRFVYAPELPERGIPIAIFLAAAAILWMVWRGRLPAPQNSGSSL